jgi:hypothetical protein
VKNGSTLNAGLINPKQLTEYPVEIKRNTGFTFNRYEDFLKEWILV